MQRCFASIEAKRRVYSLNMMKLSPKNTDLERKSLLSTLWIFVLLNMIYADILGTLRPGYLDFLDQLSQQLTDTMVLAFSVLMEVAIGMVLLSRVLTYKANRWAHFIAIPLMVLWVVVPALITSSGKRLRSLTCFLPQ